jgi:Uncharacterised nucleotidyltransferase
VIFTPEFRLALDCCSHCFRSSDSEEPVRAIEVDWTKFLRLARFHRIEGLVWNTLSGLDLDMPEEVRADLSQAASEIAARNLQSLAGSNELQTLFKAEDVALLFLKGLTLGALAYGNIALKSAIDIDLLIDPRDLAKAAELLRKHGFHLITPQDSPADRVLHAWHRGWKESVWAKDSPPLQIDLHTRTADNARLIPEIDVHSLQEAVEIGGSILPTLARDELFAYLAVHGASSAWFRIKWISDFASLLSGQAAKEIDRLYRRSQQLGAARAAGQALLVSDALFGTLGPIPVLRDELGRNPATRRLANAALQQLTGEPREPTERRGGTFTIHWTQFLLLPGLGYKLSELSRQAGRLFERPAI